MNINPDTSTVVAFCCTDWTGGGASTSDVGPLGIDGHIIIPIEGVYALDGLLTYGEGAAALAFSWVEAWIEVINPTTSTSAIAAYGRCHTNYGSIALPGQWPCEEGDQVRMWVYNRGTNTITLSNRTRLSATMIAATPNVEICGCTNEEPSPPTPPVDFSLFTDGYGTAPDPGTIESIAYLAPFDTFITEFWFDSTSPELPPGLPVLKVLVNGVVVLSIDSGDILPGEFPNQANTGLPYALTAGDSIQFQVDRGSGIRGAAGHMVIEGVGTDTVLPWA